jgi:glycosyltransferase involved in cell wall biosynthesis
MLSVLHVITRMPAWGTERQLAGLLRTAHGRHWSAELCVLYSGFALTQEVHDAGVPVVELDGSGLHLDRLRALRRLARSGRFDVVHTSLWGASAFGRIAAVGPRRPAVVMTEQRVEDFRPLRRLALDRALRVVTDEWTGNSRDVCAFILRAHGADPARVHLLSNAIDRSVFYRAVRPTEHGRTVPRVGTLGRLVPQKGLDVLMAAVPMVLHAREIEVVIAGDGELRQQLQAAASGLPVTFIGVVDGPDAVADYLRSLDVFVMPSRFEGLPNAMVEALACGLPVVATQAPGMAEAVGEAALLVPVNDPSALAQAILRSIDEPAGGDPPWFPSFDDAARDHLRVFELAVAHRGRSLIRH